MSGMQIDRPKSRRLPAAVPTLSPCDIKPAFPLIRALVAEATQGWNVTDRATARQPTAPGLWFPPMIPFSAR